MLNKLLGCAPKYIAMFLCVTSFSCFLVLSSTSTSADVIDDVIITVPAACTLNQVVDVAHVDTIQNGHLENDIGTTTFTVYCNDSAGFAIYAIGYSGDEYGGTDLIASNSNNPNIATGLTTSGTPSAWAMKLIPVTGTYTPTIENGFSSYKAVPTTYTKVASFNTLNDASIGSSIQSTYRVFAASGQAADTYTGKVRYTLVHPASEVPAQPQTTQSGKICYYVNASDAVGTMGCQDVASSVTLLASNFSRTGYGFAGWSDAFDYATNQNAHFYGPNEDITLTPADYQSPNNGLSLYAVWVKSEGNLQGWTGCSSLTKADVATNIFSESITALSDSRDNNTYAIAKLADGNCWMIENLRLDNTAVLTPENTNNPLSNEAGTAVTLKHNYTDTDTYNTLSPTSNVAYNADTAPDGWCTAMTAACYNQSRLRTDNTASRATNPASNTNNLYSYGNYYNWYSATAGNGTYSFSTNNNSVSGDICPTGWSLPKGGNKNNTANSDFWKLGVALTGAEPANTSSETIPYYTGIPEGTNASNAFRSYPNNFVYSGSVVGASVNDRSSFGLYWSSTANSSYRAYYVYFYSGNVYPGTNHYAKYNGSMARCIASGS